MGARILVGGAPDGQDRALSRRVLRVLRARTDVASCGEPGRPALAPDATPVTLWDVPDDSPSDAAGSAVAARRRDAVPVRDARG